MIPFRELFHNHDDNRLRYDMLDRHPSVRRVFFSGGDGFYRKYLAVGVSKTMERRADRLREWQRAARPRSDECGIPVES